MSAYANDPRVVGYSSGDYDVWKEPGCRPTFIQAGDYGFIIASGKASSVLDPEVFPTADEAIHSVIGDPR